MVRIGLVGLGFMGMIHYLAARKLKGAEVVAICSRDEKKLAGDWRDIKGNFGPRGEMMDLSRLKKYRRLNDLLADPDIDMIDVCNPTHLHPETALRGLAAGKHVLVEKAIALETAEADAMVAAAKKAGKLLMVAHVLPFFPEFKFLADAVRGGQNGKLLGGHFKRIISRPDWSADIGDASKTGGPAIDLHIHDTHFIGLVAGVPEKVFSVGRAAPDGAVEYLTTDYLYGSGGPTVTCSSGAVAASGRPFVHGFEIYLEKATLAYSSGGPPLTVYTADGKARPAKLKGGEELSGFTAELQTAVNGVESGKEPD